MEASKVVTELLLVQKATGVTDGLVGVVSKALLPEGLGHTSMEASKVVTELLLLQKATGLLGPSNWGD